MTLSASQTNVLNIIKTLPKKFRKNERSALKGGWIRWDVMESYDWRTVSSLIKRGLVETSEHGVRAI